MDDFCRTCVYVCICMLLLIQVSGASLNVTVPSHLYVPLETSVEIPCIFEGELLAVYWFKDSPENDTLVANAFGVISGIGLAQGYNVTVIGSLAISSTTQEKEGKYYCGAVNRKSKDGISSSCEIITTVEPSGLYPMIEECPGASGCSFKLSDENSTVSLTCVVEDAKPAIALSWKASNTKKLSYQIETIKGSKPGTRTSRAHIIFSLKEIYEEDLKCTASGPAIPDDKPHQFVVKLSRERVTTPSKSSTQGDLARESSQEQPLTWILILAVVGCIAVVCMSVMVILLVRRCRRNSDDKPKYANPNVINYPKEASKACAELDML